jgi:dihydrofolate synthase/folylpolyglutamate synthase
MPALRGQHQIQNAGLAIALARALQIDYPAIMGGLQSAYWPARMQALTTGPLVDIARARGAELWLDGGHNPHAARALATTIAGLESDSSRPLIMIMGMLANKNAPGFLDAFDGLANAVISVPIEDHQAYAPEALIDIAKGRALNAFACDTVTEAVEKACALDTEVPPRILICGSLYLSGQVLAENG